MCHCMFAYKNILYEDIMVWAVYYMKFGNCKNTLKNKHTMHNTPDNEKS